MDYCSSFRKFSQRRFLPYTVSPVSLPPLCENAELMPSRPVGMNNWPCCKRKSKSNASARVSQISPHRHTTVTNACVISRVRTEQYYPSRMPREDADEFPKLQSSGKSLPPRRFETVIWSPTPARNGRSNVFRAISRTVSRWLARNRRSVVNIPAITTATRPRETQIAKSVYSGFTASVGG